ncbi:MAG: ABC-three component system protein [Candidatus Paceibacterota bacterium]
MSNRNATASWSGYSHQGKVGIYLALKTINDQEGEINDDLILDYEKQEDVRLLQNGQPIEVHQVKAYKGKDTIGSYTDALKKFETCDGGNYLHTIDNIRNWDRLTEEQNPKNIERYKYRNGNSHCGLDEISDIIIEEIQSQLRSIEHPEAQNAGYANVIKNYLLGELDNMLRFSHHNRKYNPQFSLGRISELVTTNPDITNSKLCSIRQRFYSVYERYIADIEDLGFEITDDHFDRMKKIISDIYCLKDEEFEQFLRNINPHSTSKKSISNSLTTDDFFSHNSFSNVFMEVLQSVTNSLLELDEMHIQKYYVKDKYVLTSIDESSIRQRTVARDIAINPNIDFSKYEADYMITGGLNGSILEGANSLIKVDTNKFINPKNLKFIDKRCAIEKLNS